MPDDPRPPAPAGPGVDAAGTPVLDPTANVLGLVEAAVQRLDDLRTAEAGHVREIIAIRADYDEKLRRGEAARVDAIRSVDVAASARAAEQAATTAQVLAAQLQATAATAAASLAAQIAPLTAAIDELRRAQAEQAGARGQSVESKGTGQWAVGVAVAVGALAVAVISFIINQS